MWSAPSLRQHLMRMPRMSTALAENHKKAGEATSNRKAENRDRPEAATTITAGYSHEIIHVMVFQKNPFSVRKIFVRDSGAGNGCANFVGAWKHAFFLPENLCP